MARGVCAQCVHQRVRLDGELCPLRTPSIKYSHRRHHPAFYLVLLCARVLLLIFDAKRSERAAHKRGKKKTTRTCNLNIHNTICRMLKCTNIIQYVRRQPPPRSLRITKKRPKRMSRKKEQKRMEERGPHSHGGDSHLWFICLNASSIRTPMRCAHFRVQVSKSKRFANSRESAKKKSQNWCFVVAYRQFRKNLVQ